MKIKLIIISVLLIVCSWVWLRAGQIKGLEDSLVFREVFFDVGQGDSIFLEKGNIQVLVDGGPKQDIVLEKLSKEMGLDKKIELLIISHWDSDHIGGLLEVVKRYEIEAVLFGGGEPETEKAKDLMSLIKEKNIILKEAKVGQKIDFDGIEIGVLAPLGSEGSSNDLSAVLKVDYGDCKTLLTGDIESGVELELINTNLDMESDILKIAHHGSKSSSSEDFLKVTGSNWAIISAGRGNSYGHPHKEILERVKGANMDVLRTDERGDIAFESLGGACVLK